MCHCCGCSGGYRNRHSCQRARVGTGCPFDEFRFSPAERFSDVGGVGGGGQRGGGRTPNDPRAHRSRSNGLVHSPEQDMSQKTWHRPLLNDYQPRPGGGGVAPRDVLERPYTVGGAPPPPLPMFEADSQKKFCFAAFGAKRI